MVRNCNDLLFILVFLFRFSLFEIINVVFNYRESLYVFMNIDF